MSFRSVFVAVVIAFALILAAFLINRARPTSETGQPSADLVRATGKCAECHARLQYSVVHEYEMSQHARKGVNCLDCHQPAPGQEKKDHHGGHQYEEAQPETMTSPKRSGYNQCKRCPYD